MTVKKVLARGWTFEINTGTIAVPVWVEIKGVTSFKPKPGKKDADAGDFDSAGIDEHVVASRSYELTLSGKYLEDPDNGDRDPGQEALEALADAVGDDSLKQHRVTTPGGTVKVALFSADVVPGGGERDDLADWETTLTRSGAWS